MYNMTYAVNFHLTLLVFLSSFNVEHKDRMQIKRND